MDNRPKCKIIKLIDENTGENLLDCGLDKEFLHMTPKVQSTKENVYLIKWTSSKLEIFAL